MGPFTGTTALLTGACTGIGLAAARRLAAEGAHVYLTGRRKDTLEAAAETIGVNATAIQGDVSDVASRPVVGTTARTVRPPGSRPPISEGDALLGESWAYLEPWNLEPHLQLRGPPSICPVSCGAARCLLPPPAHSFAASSSMTTITFCASSTMCSPMRESSSPALPRPALRPSALPAGIGPTSSSWMFTWGRRAVSTSRSDWWWRPPPGGRPWF